MKVFIVVIFLFIGSKESLSQSSNRGVPLSATIRDSSIFNGKTYAVIVGISNYKYITPLSFADKDALLFKEFLESKAGGNVQQDNILLILNQDAGAATELRMLYWLRRTKKIKKGDRVYFYFAGHGDAINPGQYYFLLQNCDPGGDQINYRGAMTSVVSMYDLKSYIKYSLTLAGIDAVIIWDACRTNELPGGENGLKALQESIAEKNNGELTMLSASAGETSIESSSYAHGHGLFTYYLIDALSGAADDPKEGGNNDGKVDITELETWVKSHVRNDAKNKFKRNQNPKFIYNNNAEAISITDSLFNETWSLQKMQADNSSLSYNKPPVRAIQSADSLVVELYNRVMEAVKQENKHDLYIAESLYAELQKKYPTHPLTNEAGFNLAMEYINIAQDKINFYLSGKDESLVLTRSLENDTTHIIVNPIHEAMSHSFSANGIYLANAVRLLKKNNETDSFYLQQIQAKSDFLMALGFYNNEGVVRDFSQALKLAWSAFHKNPNTAYNNHLIGLLYSYEKKYDSSLLFEQKALQLAPKWNKPCRTIGYNYYNQKKYDSAESYFKKAIHLIPGDKYAYNYLAITFLDQKKYDAADSSFVKAIEIDSSYADACNNLGISKQSRYFDTYFHEILTRNTGQIMDGNRGLAGAYSSSAEPYFHKALLIDSLHKYANFNLGNILNEKKSFDSAKMYFKKAIAADTQYAYAYAGLGHVLRDQKKYDSAILLYRKASLIDSMCLIAYVGLATSFEQQKLYDSAKKYHYILIRLDSLNVLYYLMLGNVFAIQKIADSTIFNYKKAVALNPYFVPALAKLAISYANINQLDSSEFYAKASLHIENNSASLNALVGVLLSKKRQYDSSIAYLLNSLKLNPGDTTVLSMSLPFGEYFISQKKYRAAIILYTELLNIDSSNRQLILNPSVKKQVNYYLGLAYLMSNREEIAAGYYSKAENIKGYYYDLACKHSLEKDLSGALKSLELSFMNGFKDYTHLQQDADLDNIRNTDGFKQLLKKYFPDE